MNGWLGVVSGAHVQRGAKEGFAQVCHGKAQPLRRMKRGDVRRFVGCYSVAENPLLFSLQVAVGIRAV